MSNRLKIFYAMVIVVIASGTVDFFGHHEIATLLLLGGTASVAYCHLNRSIVQKNRGRTCSGLFPFCELGNYPRFSATASQFTTFHQASIYSGRRF